MSIFRIEKKSNYVVLDKGFLNDRRLSWQAKGLLAYMLSLPNDFISENIAQWVDDLGSELVIEAMKRALKAQKKWNYAEGILRDWFLNNIRTLEDVEAYETEWKNQQRGRQHAIHQPSTPTPSETESEVRKAIERRKRIAESTLDSEDNNPF